MKQKILNLILAAISLSSFSTMQPMMRAMALRSARPTQMMTHAKTSSTSLPKLKQPKSSCFFISSPKQEKKHEENWYKNNKNFKASLYPQKSSYSWALGITAGLTAWGFNYVENEKEKEEILQELNKAFYSIKLSDFSKAQDICKNKLERLIQNNHKSSIDIYHKMLSIIVACKKGEELLQRETLTPTEKHLLDNKKSVTRPYELPHQYMENQELREFSQSIIEKERELMQQDLYTLVHGQKKFTYFPAQLYTLLWEISNDVAINDYIFPWIAKPITDKQELLKESKKRTDLLKNHIPNGRNDQIDTLFLNYALWANSNDIGESSAYYVKQNFNHNFSRIEIKEIFNFFGCEPIYKSYQEEIELLAKEYNRLSNKGNILVFGIPKDKINDLVYHAYRHGHHVDNASKCSDVLEQHLKSNIESSGSTMFCMPMTFDMALNPKSGIKIFPIISGDQTKLKELQAKEKALFEKIRKTATELKK